MSDSEVLAYRGMDGSATANPTVAELRDVERFMELLPSYSGVFGPSMAYPQFSLDDLLGSKGYEFVENMLRMAACRAPFNLKRYAVMKDGWTIEPAVTDPFHPDHVPAKEIADAARCCFENLLDPRTDRVQDFQEVIFASLMGAWTGNRGAELVWRYDEGGIQDGRNCLQGIYDKVNYQLAFEVDRRTMEPLNFTSYTPGDGLQYGIPVEAVQWWMYGANGRDAQGIGDWRGCFPHWTRLQANLKFWAMALERWGAPCLLLLYAAGQASEAKLAAEAGNKIRKGGTAVLPDTIGYEILTVPSGVFESMQKAADWDTRQCAYNVNSNTLASLEGEKGATSAGSTEHSDSGDTVHDYLSRRMEREYKYQAIRRFVRYNFGDRALGLTPNLRLRNQETGDLLEIAQSLNLLIQAGNMPSGSKIIRERMGLPPIDPDEQALLAAESAAKLEAANQLSDARQRGAIQGSMSTDFVEGALKALTFAIYAKQQV